ncbi:hypothetical protein AMAG_04185 [Allomyces macrogynus ATCC 38327]|uniref:F-box domain-containing protein n=1 Tax=Allomyces macrogynus (strain ATCC 38327) TaxID=578462 RepID=A0A0L0S7Z7_ALLM3|nr:hypothetical protein AMAG_04185 [Allomyces macrogynus ATCC 38327]|eukprot:KNE58622.1 hypothetical protein AMAG_04185 [Allomyces macrogynus ATCC 38327]
MDTPQIPVTEDELEQFRKQWKNELSAHAPHPATASSSGSSTTNSAVTESRGRPPALAPVHVWKASHHRTIGIMPSAEDDDEEDESEPTVLKQPTSRARSSSKKHVAKTVRSKSRPRDALPHAPPPVPLPVRTPVPLAAKADTSSSSSSSSSSAAAAVDKVADAVAAVSVADKSAPLASGAEDKAMQLYQQGMDLEHEGNLAGALKAYRAAFKIDAHIDIRYQRHYAAVHGLKAASSNKDAGSSTKAAVPATATATPLPPFNEWLEQIRREPCPLQPRTDLRPTFISVLPAELLARAFKFAIAADTNAFFALSLVCKKFCLVAREPTIWKHLCFRHYPPEKVLVDAAAKEDWLQYFIREPRIRFDGVYISRCMYVRQGISEFGFNNPVHLVEYFRYLRFFRDGRVLSYMTTSEPRDIVKQFTESHLESRKGFMTGTYVQNGAVVDLTLTDKRRAHNTFTKTVQIKGSKRGKHNRLHWVHYSFTTINHHAEQEIVELDLTEFRPYVFSKVKSYGSA